MALQKAHSSIISEYGNTVTFSVALLSVLFAVLLFHNNPGPDYWYHLFLGQQVWETKSFQPADQLLRDMPSYLNLYWFYQSVQYWLYAKAGAWGVYVLYVSLGFSTACLWLKVLKPGRDWNTGVGFLVLGSLLVWNTRFEWRPEMVSYAGLSYFVYIVSRANLEHLSPVVLITAALVQWVWTNSHGYFIFGPSVLALAIVFELANKSHARLRSLVKLLLVTLTASLAGPFHIHSWTHVLHMQGFLNSMAVNIQEFMPSYKLIYLRVWTTVLFWMFWVVTFFTSAWFLRVRARWLHSALAFVGIYFSFRYYRNVPLLLIFSAPLWAETWVPILSTKGLTSPNFGKALRFALPATLGALILGVISGVYYESRFSSTRFGLAVTNEHAPLSFSNFLATTKFTGKVFNNASDGGFLELHAPQIRVYGDSRFSDRTATVQHFDALNNADDFKQLDKKHNFDGVLLRILENQTLIYSLLNSPDWILAYTDLHRAFFVSPNTSAGSVFEARQYRFYENEDISAGDNLYKALQWCKFLGAQQRFTLLDDALENYLRLPVIHPGVAAIAFRLYEGRGDNAKLYALRSVRGNIKSLSGEDYKFVMSKLTEK